MAKQRRFNIGKAPFIRKADSSRFATKSIMFDFIIALTPVILFAWYKNGILPFVAGNIGVLQMLYPLIFIAVGGLTCYIIEGLYYTLFMKEENIAHKLRYSYPLIPGVLLAMILPLHTPIWVLIIGCLFATVVGKLLFGGFGYNLFNPALVGYLFVVVAFFPVIIANGGILNPNEVEEIISGATPLAGFLGDINNLDATIDAYGGLFNFFVGMIPGSIAETSALFCIISFIYLLARRIINWRIPVIYAGTVFVLTFIIGSFHGYGIRFPLFNIFSGGLMFSAVFMATESVTSPRNPVGEVIYALFIGVIVVMLRYISNMAEGAAVAILFMNIFTPIIDNFTAKVRVYDKPMKMVMSYGYVGVLFLLIFGFTLMRMGVFA